MSCGVREAHSSEGISHLYHLQIAVVNHAEFNISSDIVHSTNLCRVSLSSDGNRSFPVFSPTVACFVTQPCCSHFITNREIFTPTSSRLPVFARKHNMQVRNHIAHCWPRFSASETAPEQLFQLSCSEDTRDVLLQLLASSAAPEPQQQAAQDSLGQDLLLEALQLLAEAPDVTLLADAAVLQAQAEAAPEDEPLPAQTESQSVVALLLTRAEAELSPQLSHVLCCVRCASLREHARCCDFGCAVCRCCGLLLACRLRANRSCTVSARALALS